MRLRNEAYGGTEFKGNARLKNPYWNHSTDYDFYAVEFMD